ncbi:hypothetical protein Tsp_11155 [Trichinella spiralis]|uniref:hypothetical protein n=1 Tax=Trichinella spiralis TaxID=6334 RepID=UPI0001EFEC9E|nr:hypothetical protein Tsp_11155 [Trichinella spiralis]
MKVLFHRWRDRFCPALWGTFSRRSILYKLIVGINSKIDGDFRGAQLRIVNLNWPGLLGMGKILDIVSAVVIIAPSDRQTLFPFEQEKRMISSTRPSLVIGRTRPGCLIRPSGKRPRVVRSAGQRLCVRVFYANWINFHLNTTISSESQTAVVCEKGNSRDDRSWPSHSTATAVGHWLVHFAFHAYQTAKMVAVLEILPNSFYHFRLSTACLAQISDIARGRLPVNSSLQHHHHHHRIESNDNAHNIVQ